MAVIDDLLANNRAFAARYDRGHLGVRPSLRLAIVTCIDSRLDVFAALGLEDGQAHILRNAGGVITGDVIRSLAISQRRLGTEEVMLIHHTDCGPAAHHRQRVPCRVAGGHRDRPVLRDRVVHRRRRRRAAVNRSRTPLAVPSPPRSCVRSRYDVDTGVLRQVR